MAYSVIWSYGKPIIREETTSPEVVWSYGKPVVIWDDSWSGGVTGRISRYHDLDGLGGLGQQTFNPME